MSGAAMCMATMRHTAESLSRRRIKSTSSAASAHLPIPVLEDDTASAPPLGKPGCGRGREHSYRPAPDLVACRPTPQGWRAAFPARRLPRGQRQPGHSRGGRRVRTRSGRAQARPDVVRLANSKTSRLDRRGGLVPQQPRERGARRPAGRPTRRHACVRAGEGAR